jgi:hypothetical protein
VPLLKKPLPVIPKRLYHVRLEEPLALRMERYAEFLEAKTVDHVISQALDFVFNKDSDFKVWLAEHPETNSPSNGKRIRKDTKPNGNAVSLDERSSSLATARSTI